MLSNQKEKAYFKALEKLEHETSVVGLVQQLRVMRRALKKLLTRQEYKTLRH